MPAGPSSLLKVVAGRSAAPDRPGLVEALSGVPDPRDPRGIRYPLPPVLAVAAAAVLTGARSFDAISEWAHDVPYAVRARLGLDATVPDEATFRRILEAVDDAVFTSAVATWLGNRAGRRAGRRLIAVDGKTTRGARIEDVTTPHLLAALEHTTGVVLGQVQVDGKSNEITSFQPLLDPIDLSNAVVTADALHTQNGHAEYLHERRADWIFTVKGNRPKLLTELTGLPWKEVAVAASSNEKAHGRLEQRSLKVVTVSRGISFPHAAQAIQLVRRTRRGKGTRWHTEVVYAITSFTAERIQGSELLSILRRHWAIENELHWIRDVTFGEDASRVRTGHGPAMMAALRNLAISLAHLTGADNIAAWTRSNSRNPSRPIALLSPP